MPNISVLVVDDSAVVRKVFTEIFSATPGIELINTAPDPIFAMKKMENRWPDVIILDIEMPRMDGITFLKQIMAEHPTPIIICSTLTEKGAETTMSALAAGAVDIITKPKLDLKNYLSEQRNALIHAVKAAAQAKFNKTHVAQSKPRRIAPSPIMSPAPSQAPARKIVAQKNTADVILAAPGNTAMNKTTESVIALGTSTGGTQALESILTQLPRTSPGIVVVQHMPEKFTRAFSDRLNGICEVNVKEAENGDRVIPGRVLIAPGGKHMLLKRSGAQYIVEIVDGPLVSRHKPSVDVLFRSVAATAGKNALGIIMTGMGDDGANGLLEMRQAGADTLGQDEQSCIVYGMPKEAYKRGAVMREVALQDIPDYIISRSSHHIEKKVS